MHTVLMRLSAPMQSWGTASLWEDRATAVRPTKAAVVGIVANALGYERADDLSALAPLMFAVRADRPGEIRTDHQTAGGGGPHPPVGEVHDGPSAPYGAPRNPEIDPAGALHANTRPAARTPVLVTKQYVADGAFLAGLSTPHRDLAAEIAAALTHPARALYLGRRAFPPAHPVYHGTTDHSPESWPDVIPLLPEATDPLPWVWIESPPGPGAVASPEQVPTTYTERDHGLLHLRSRRTRPSASELPENAA